VYYVVRKMKKFLILTLIFIGLIPSAVMAQDDLLAKRDLYIEAQKKFTSSRQSYLNNPTLQQKDILSSDLGGFVYARNELLIVYFEDLIDRSKDYLLQPEFEKVVNWRVFLKQQNEQIVSETSIVNLIFLSDGFAGNFQQINTDVNKSLVSLTIAEQEAVIKKIEIFQLEVAQSLISGVVDEDLVITWLQEVAKKLAWARGAHVQAREIAVKMRLIRGNAKNDSDLNKIKQELLAANQEIKEALTYLDEIVKRIEKNE